MAKENLSTPHKDAKPSTRSLDQEALDYHSQGKPGKIEVIPSKKCDTEHALSLAYSPGVAAPVIEIAKDPDAVFKYTAKGNLVAVITNGTAILGLGDLGPLASKPVMEGKGILFKKFANIDVFDIEMQTETTEDFIKAVKALEPTFGGINLEDIAAPECFIIEERLKKEMNIPVFHDDQHGTAIICGAAMLNACEVTGKSLKSVRVVFNGAGASAISCARVFVKLGVPKSNIMMCDSKGVLYKGRSDGMNKYKDEFVVATEARSLADALRGADIFVGLSVAGVMTEDMLMSMAAKPIVFAMANPDPEISPKIVKRIRPETIVATGRSDFPNQVNNVLGFPSIFRGALDVRATQINEEMKLAAVHALAQLAREDVPESVSTAYGEKSFSFGPEYLIPKPFDPRVLTHVAPAVAKAAMETNVARKPILDLQEYKEKLESLGSVSRGFVRSIINRIKDTAEAKNEEVPVVVFPEGSSERVLRALQLVVQEGFARPILLGYEDSIRAKMKELELDELLNVPIFQPSRHPEFENYVEKFYHQRQRKGVMQQEAERLISNPYYFGAMMIQQGAADAMVSGATQNYADSVSPILQVLGTRRDHVASGLSIILTPDGRVLFFADTTVNVDPSAEQVASIAIHASEVAQFFGIKPRIALLSYSNFTAKIGSPKKMREALDIIQKRRPDLMVDGEMQADTAVNPDILGRIFPFSPMVDGANILVFPNLESGNISYKLLQQLGSCDILGPFLMGTKNAAHVLQRTSTVENVFNFIALTTLHSQAIKEYQKRKAKQGSQS